jgi:hypothetical protein
MLIAASCAEAFVPLIDFVRLRTVEVFVLLATLFAVVFSASGDAFDSPRKRVWRDKTVAFEHVDVERTACFTDSTEESESRVVTAIGTIVYLPEMCKC